MVQEVVSCWACPPTPSGGSVTEGVSRRKSASAVCCSKKREEDGEQPQWAQSKSHQTTGPENRPCDPQGQFDAFKKSRNGWRASSVRSCFLALPSCLHLSGMSRRSSKTEVITLLHIAQELSHGSFVHAPYTFAARRPSRHHGSPCRTTEQRPMACACALAGGVECVGYA